MKSIIADLIGAGVLCLALLTAGCGNVIEQPGSTTPATPTGVTATSGINKVQLTWDPVPGATSYNIYWSISPGVTKATGTRESVAGRNYFDHVGLYVSQTYFYVVSAVNGYGESAVSSQAATVAATDSANLYITYCKECHGPVTSFKAVAEGTPENINAAIASNKGGMGKLSVLTQEQIEIISLQLPCH